MSNLKLIDKVLSGEASPDEVRALNEWIDRDPRNREEYEDVKLLWEIKQEELDRKQDPNFYDGLYKIKRMIERQSSPFKWDWKGALSIAAILISILALAYCCYSIKTSADKSLIFSDRTLKEVIQVAQQRFDIIIEVENSAVLTCKFSGAFSSKSTPEDIIKKITVTFGFTYQALGKQRFKINGDGCR